MLRLFLAIVAAASVASVPAMTSAAPASGKAVAQPSASTLQRIRESGVIRLAHRESSIPFSYLDVKKRPIGYALDLCLMVADSLRHDLKLPGLKVEYVPVSPAARMSALLEGKADLECGSTSNTAARRKDVAFTNAHYFAGARLLVRSDSPYKRLSDLRGKRIVISQGTTAAAALKTQAGKGLIASTLVEAKDYDEAFAILEKGEADAFVTDDILLYSLRAASKDPGKWDVVGEFISVEPIAIMLRKGDPEFKKYVDGVLARAMIDGDVRKSYGKWFLAPIPPKGINLNIPMSPLLREQMLYPTDKAGDEIGG
ncbi:MAG: amino acid ABC transporter substrate-binding protein [Burkholderiaceae bacterium]